MSRIIRFHLDVANIARIDWPKGRDDEKLSHLSRIEYVSQVVEDLTDLVGKYLPDWECMIDGHADHSLRFDFKDQGIEDKYWAMMRSYGFVDTSNTKQKADPVILAAAAKSGAIVVARDKFAEYDEFHGWLYDGGRFVQPVPSSAGWTFREFRHSMGDARNLEQILVDYEPTVRNFAQLGGVNADAVAAILSDESHIVLAAESLAGADRQRVLSAINTARRFPHMASVLRRDLSRDEVLVELQNRGIDHVPVVGDVLLNEEGKAVVGSLSASEQADSQIRLAIERREIERLERVIRILPDNDQLKKSGRNLIACLKGTETPNWAEVMMLDVDAVNWCMDSLRAQHDTAKLSSIPIRIARQSMPRLQADFWCARYLEGRVNLGRLIGELDDLKTSLSAGSVLLWRSCGERINQEALHDGAICEAEQMVLARLSRLLQPGNLLAERLETINGDTTAIYERQRVGDTSIALELAKTYFWQRLQWNWIPESTLVEIINDSDSLSELRTGQLGRIVTTSPITRLINQGEDIGEVPVRAVVALSQIHLATVRVSQVFTEIKKQLEGIGGDVELTI